MLLNVDLAAGAAKTQLHWHPAHVLRLLAADHLKSGHCLRLHLKT